MQISSWAFFFASWETIRWVSADAACNISTHSVCDWIISSFVPAKIPRKRRLQTLAVAGWSVMIIITTFIFLILWWVSLCFCSVVISKFGCSSFPPFWPPLLAYLVWMRFIDNSPEHGGRLSPWFRSLRFWKYFAEYYPASCVHPIPNSLMPSIDDVMK